MERVWSCVNVVETSSCFLFSLYTISGCLSLLLILPSLCAMFLKNLVLEYRLPWCLDSALAFPVYNSSCLLQISMQACDSPFVFSRSLTMLIQFETQPHQILLGKDWFFLFQDAMAGYSVSIGSSYEKFPATSIPPPAPRFSRNMDGKYSTQLYPLLCDFILLYSGGPLQVPLAQQALSFSYSWGYFVTSPVHTHADSPLHTPALTIAHPCGYIIARPSG